MWNNLGDLLPLQIIYTGTTNRSHPKYAFPSGWHMHIALSKPLVHRDNYTRVCRTHCASENIREMLYNDQTAALIIMDNFKGQITKK